MRGRETPIRDSLTLPWDAFVAAFLYYVGLTLAVIGGADLSATAMGAAYLAAPAVAAAVIAARLVHASAREFGHAMAPSPASVVDGQTALKAAM